MQFKILDKKIVYDGFFRMETYRLSHELFRGGWTGEVYRECLERGHAVALLPYDPLRDEVVLAEQFRVGALEAETGPWLLEIVAGILDKDGETPEQVARREAMEEAGCQVVGELEFISHYYVSPGGTSETVTLYCGRVSSEGVEGIHGLADEHEDIRVRAVPRAEAWQMVRDGRINSAAPIIALQWLELNQRELRRRWGGAED